MCHREQAGEVSDGHTFLWEKKLVRDARRWRREGFGSRAGVSHPVPWAAACATSSPGCGTWCQAAQLVLGKVPDFLRGPRKVGARNLGSNGHLLLA